MGVMKLGEMRPRGKFARPRKSYCGISTASCRRPLTSESVIAHFMVLARRRVAELRSFVWWC
eukprot:324525-Amphidinium_carterae.1